MARNFPSSNLVRISLGDLVAPAEFLSTETWTHLGFARVDSNTSDDRNIWSKWGQQNAKRQAHIRIDGGPGPPSPFVNVGHNNVDAQITSDTAITLSTWYLFAVACDGANGLSLWIYKMDGTSLLSTTPNTGSAGGDASDLSGAIVFGLTDSGNDEMDGDIAHVAYIEREFATQDVLDYLRNPARKVAAEIIRSGVQYYLPLGLGSPEPDFSGQGNSGTITGNSAIADNPPTAPWYGFDHGWRGGLAAVAAIPELQDTHRIKISRAPLPRHEQQSPIWFPTPKAFTGDPTPIVLPMQVNVTPNIPPRFIPLAIKINVPQEEIVTPFLLKHAIIERQPQIAPQYPVAIRINVPKAMTVDPVPIRLPLQFYVTPRTPQRFIPAARKIEIPKAFTGDPVPIIYPVRMTVAPNTRPRIIRVGTRINVPPPSPPQPRTPPFRIYVTPNMPPRFIPVSRTINIPKAFTGEPASIVQPLQINRAPLHPGYRKILPIRINVPQEEIIATFGLQHFLVFKKPLTASERQYRKVSIRINVPKAFTGDPIPVRIPILVAPTPKEHRRSLPLPIMWRAPGEIFVPRYIPFKVFPTPKLHRRSLPLPIRISVPKDFTGDPTPIVPPMLMVPHGHIRHIRPTHGFFTYQAIEIPIGVRLNPFLKEMKSLVRSN